MSENNDTSSESNSRSDENSILQAPRLSASGGGNSLIRSGVLRPSVLGQSVLGSNANNAADVGSASGETKSNHADSNPFMKDQSIDMGDDEAIEGAVGGEEKNDKKAVGREEEKRSDDEEPDERPDPLSLLRKNGIERANLFAAARNSIPRVEKSGFVFGQNVHERVVGDNIGCNSSKSAAENELGTSSGELLFSSVIQNATKTSEQDKNAVKETNVKSLIDVAREYEESRAQKRKYEEVETFTGEENELNIVNVNCKLFAFVNSNWEQRGRGSLRLNDSKNENEFSRVVFRTSGSLRLLLNTKVWAGMVAERPSQKSLRMTAMDTTGKIKIFLLMARPNEISKLHKALVDRIDRRKASHPEECRAANDNSCEESKNAAAYAVAEHPDDEEEDDGIAQSAPADAKPQDNLAEPSPKKPGIGEEVE